MWGVTRRGAVATLARNADWGDSGSLWGTTSRCVVVATWALMGANDLTASHCRPRTAAAATTSQYKTRPARADKTGGYSREDTTHYTRESHGYGKCLISRKRPLWRITTAGSRRRYIRGRCRVIHGTRGSGWGAQHPEAPIYTRLPRSSCSRSMDSNRDLKLPAPKPLLPSR